MFFLPLQSVFVILSQARSLCNNSCDTLSCWRKKIKTEHSLRENTFMGSIETCFKRYGQIEPDMNLYSTFFVSSLVKAILSSLPCISFQSSNCCPYFLQLSMNLSFVCSRDKQAKNMAFSIFVQAGWRAEKST